MRVINLASGSKGNATLIEHNSTRILVDAGLPLKDLEERLKNAGCEAGFVSAVLVSHNHIDHTRSVARFAKKYGTPVFLARECFFDPHLKDINGAQKQEIGLDDFFVGDILVSTFEVPHDALKTLGFVFCCDGNKISLVTDVGRLDDLAINKLAGSNLIMIESNYDDYLLENGPYPYPLKRRIASNMGHLSNVDCAKAVVKLSKMGTKYFMLMHLSEINNTPQIAYNTTMNYLVNEFGEQNEIKVLMANQYSLSPNFIFKPREKGDK